MSVEETATINPQRHSPSQVFWIGVAVFLCYFGLLGSGYLVRLVSPTMDDAAVILRETINLGMVALIAWIVCRVERRSLHSIGLKWRSWWPTIGWSFAVAFVCLATAIGLILLIRLTGTPYGSENPFAQLSPWTVTLITIRAGVAEEFMMRGYLLSRIEEWTGSTRAAVALTLIPFALLHFQQGLAGILISFVLGGILTIFFVWKRDLWTNMLAHFLVDFIPNVLLPPPA